MEDVAAVPVLEGAGESISWTWIDPDAAVLVQGAELVVDDATSVLLRANAPKVEKDGETLAEGVVAAEAEAVAVAANGVEVVTDGRGGEDDTGASFSVVKVQ